MWVFIPLAVLELVFHLWGINIRIYWIDGCKGFKEERVTLIRVLYHHAPYWHRRAWGRTTCVRTYIYRHIPYRQPPLYQGLRISKGHRVTGLQGHRVTRYPSSQESRVSQDHRVTETQGHRVTGSRGYQIHIITGSLDHLSHTRLSPWLGSPGSPWSQGYPGSRVTWSLGNQVSG